MDTKATGIENEGRLHEPLSRRLETLLAHGAEGTPLTLNLLLEKTEGRGVFLIIILLCLPFLAPASVPGMSPPLGMVIALLALAVIRGRAASVPRRLGDRVLSEKVKRVMLGGGLKVLRFIEKIVKPRRSTWMAWKGIHTFNLSLIIFMAFLLALPLPPVVLFTNAMPAYAVLLLAASMMEEDGFMIWFGYLISAVTTVYFIFIAFLFNHYLIAWLHKLLDWFRGN
jgi:hypothetical protein